MSLKETKKISANRYELEILIDGETFREAIMEAYRKNVGDITVPGFRKGKVPYKFAEKYLGVEVFYEDALNLVYGDALDAAIDEAGLKAIDDKMDFDLVSISKEDGVDFKVALTTYPEIELGDYKGLKAEKVIPEAEDFEIDAEIKTMAERNARMVEVTDRSAQSGDNVVIDFEGFIDGVPFDGGKAEGHTLQIGSGSFIPGFEDQLIDHNVGDEFDITVTFPEDYGEESLSDKEAVFKIKLHSIKHRELPDIDDEFAKDVSEFDTLADLKADIKAKILDKKQKSAEEDLENDLVKQVVDTLKGEIPEVMFSKRVDECVENFGFRLRSQGLDMESYFKYTNSSRDELRKSLRPDAESQVKTALTLEKIVELENITVSEEEIEERYKELADGYHMKLEEIKKVIPSEDVSAELAKHKAIDLVKENAVITEVKAKTEKAPAKKKTTKKAPAKKKPAKKDGEPAEAKPEEKPAEDSEGKTEADE